MSVRARQVEAHLGGPLSTRALCARADFLVPAAPQREKKTKVQPKGGSKQAAGSGAGPGAAPPDGGRRRQAVKKDAETERREKLKLRRDFAGAFDSDSEGEAGELSDRRERPAQGDYAPQVATGPKERRGQVRKRDVSDTQWRHTPATESGLQRPVQRFTATDGCNDRGLSAASQRQKHVQRQKQVQRPKQAQLQRAERASGQEAVRGPRKLGKPLKPGQPVKSGHALQVQRADGNIGGMNRAGAQQQQGQVFGANSNRKVQQQGPTWESRLQRSKQSQQSSFRSNPAHVNQYAQMPARKTVTAYSGQKRSNNRSAVADDMADFIVDDDGEPGDQSAQAALAELRKVTRYDPSTYRDEPFDDRKMEVGFAGCIAEEKRSARLGREEDMRAELIEKQKADAKARQKKRLKY